MTPIIENINYYVNALLDEGFGIRQIGPSLYELYDVVFGAPITICNEIELVEFYNDWVGEKDA